MSHHRVGRLSGQSLPISGESPGWSLKPRTTTLHNASRLRKRYSADLNCDVRSPCGRGSGGPSDVRNFERKEKRPFRHCSRVLCGPNNPRAGLAGYCALYVQVVAPKCLAQGRYRPLTSISSYFPVRRVIAAAGAPFRYTSKNVCTQSAEMASPRRPSNPPNPTRRKSFMAA